MKGLFGFGKKGNENRDNPPEMSPVSKKWLVQYDRKDCIGAGTCEAVNPERWKLLDTKKAELKDANLKENNMYELHIDDDELEKMKMAAEGCPKNVIHIINTETGEKVI